MVPNGWKYTQADKICPIITKGTTPPKSEVSDQGEIPFLRANNLTFNGVIDYSSKMIFVSEESHKNFLSRSIAYPNDVLMNIVGPPLGKTALLDNTYPQYNLNQAIVFYRLNKEIVDSLFFLSYINSYTAQQWLQSQSKKTSGQQNLTIAICKELPILLPPMPEQQKIAKILSTWDKAIETTEKLISNSQAQKRALMQQLLTGKKRLLDENGERFSGKWEKTALNKLTVITKGTQRNRNTLTQTDLFPVINGGTAPSGYTSEYNTEANTITISEGGNSCGYIGFQKEKFWCGGHCYSLSEVKIHNSFLYQLLKLHEAQIMRLRVGSGLPNIQRKAIESYSLKIPPNHSEQKMIANILSEADREIELLDNNLKYLKQEKRALMQQLLTGKRRVTIN